MKLIPYLPLPQLRHPFGKWRSSDSYSEFPLRQVQRSACSSRQTQLCLGEEPVQWVGSLTAPSTRTNPWSGNAERTIQHLWIHPKDVPLYFHSSADTDILHFQKRFSWIMWRPVFIFVAVLNHLIVAWTVQMASSYSALHFDMGTLGWVLICMCNSIVTHMQVCQASAHGLVLMDNSLPLDLTTMGLVHMEEPSVSQMSAVEVLQF